MSILCYMHHSNGAGSFNRQWFSLYSFFNLNISFILSEFSTTYSNSGGNYPDLRPIPPPSRLHFMLLVLIKSFFSLQRLSWKDGNIDWLVNWERCLCTQLSKYQSRCNQCSNQPVNLWLSMPPARPRFPQLRTAISRDGRSTLWNVSAFPSTQNGRWTQYYHYGTLGRADYYWQAKWCVSVL